ncbi:MAG TPA: double-CXXCG motif protein [Archangium sp.]
MSSPGAIPCRCRGWRCAPAQPPAPASPSTAAQPLLLEASSLPDHLEVFRLEDFSTLVVCTERFAEVCQRLGLDGIAFHPLPTR